MLRTDYEEEEIARVGARRLREDGIRAIQEVKYEHEAAQRAECLQSIAVLWGGGRKRISFLKH